MEYNEINKIIKENEVLYMTITTKYKVSKFKKTIYEECVRIQVNNLYFYVHYYKFILLQHLFLNMKNKYYKISNLINLQYLELSNNIVVLVKLKLKKMRKIFHNKNNFLFMFLL